MQMRIAPNIHIIDVKYCIKLGAMLPMTISLIMLSITMKLLLSIDPGHKQYANMSNLN